MRISAGVLLAASMFLAGTASAGQQEAANPAPVQSVNFQAIVAKGTTPLNEKISYRLYRLEPSYLRGPVGEYEGASIVAELSTGLYRVVTAYRDTTDYEDFEVTSETRQYTVNLNAGAVHMTAIPAPGKPPLKKGVRWEIVTYGKDADGNRRLITSSDASQAEFILPAGYYIAKVLVKGKEIRHTIEVTEGATFKYSVVLQ